jgi:ribokinase
MKALVIGGATIDVITTIEPDDIEFITMRNATNSYLMMEQGKKVEASRIDSYVGGGAANASVCMARLGAKVSSVLKLGNDLDGENITDRLNDEGINTDYVVKEKKHPTGKAVVVCSHDRNSGIFVNRGANTTLKPKNINDKMFEGIDLVYVSTLSAQSAEMFPRIVKKAKKAGALVACNPGIRQIRRRKDQLLSALKFVDILAINKEEAEALCLGTVSPSTISGEEDNPVLLAQGLGEKGARVSLQDFASDLHNRGCQHLVITNGSEGAYLCTPNAILFRPAIKCDVASTIGAGDAFNATFSYAIASKQTIWRALGMAAVNASSVASSLDTQSGLMGANTLNSRVLVMDNSSIPTFPLKTEDAA